MLDTVLNFLERGENSLDEDYREAHQELSSLSRSSIAERSQDMYELLYMRGKAKAVTEKHETVRPVEKHAAEDEIGLLEALKDYDHFEQRAEELKEQYGNLV